MIIISKGMSDEGKSLVADADEGLIEWTRVYTRLSLTDIKLFEWANRPDDWVEDLEARVDDPNAVLPDMPELLELVLESLN